jgi:hypothetical protein
LIFEAKQILFFPISPDTNILQRENNQPAGTYVFRGLLFIQCLPVSVGKNADVTQPRMIDQ